MNRSRCAKIVATLGPSSSTFEQIENLFKIGVDVFRLNFSHGKHEDHRERYDIIRAIGKKYNHPIAVLLDLQGPKLRVGTFENGKVQLKSGQVFLLDQDPTPGNQSRVCLPHPEIFDALKPGSNLLLDDGKLKFIVKSVKKNLIEAEVLIGGELSNRKGVNVPDVILPLSAITQKDKEDLEFGLHLGVDWVALSFVQKPEDIIEARSYIQDKAFLIAKIEKPKAIEALDEIVKLSDGVMVARGDLGVEMLPEDVPIIQRQIVDTCLRFGKPVVVATQMLESMISNPTPTRAETSDVASAIYMGADAVMLSAESASGQYPNEAVDIMDRIIKRVESSIDHDTDVVVLHNRQTISDTISSAVNLMTKTIPVKSIFVFTATGSSAMKIANERPNAPIFALTPNDTTAHRLNLVWGVKASVSHEIYSFTQMVETAKRLAAEENLAQKGENILVVAGVPFGSPGGSNIIHVIEI
jgi:pyruvate kinase